MTSSSSEVGKVLRRHLEAQGTSQAKFATTASISAPYLSNFMTGQRQPSAGWVNLMADTLGLTAEQRAEMHRAAAKDNGFQIDLT